MSWLGFGSTAKAEEPAPAAAATTTPAAAPAAAAATPAATPINNDPALVSELVATRKELDETQDALKKSEASRAATEAENERLKADAAAKEMSPDERVASLQSQLDEMTRKYETAKLELGDAVQKYRTLVIDASKAAAAEAATNQAVKDSLDKLRDDNAKVNANHDQETAALRAQLRCLQKENERKENQIDSLQTDIRKLADDKLGDVKNLVDANGDQKAKHAKLTGTLQDEVNQANDKAGKLLAEKEAVHDATGGLEKEKNQLTVRYEEVARQVAGLEDELARLQRQIDADDAEKKRLREALGDALKTARDAQVENSDLKTNIESLRAEVDGHHRTHGSHESQQKDIVAIWEGKAAEDAATMRDMSNQMRASDAEKAQEKARADQLERQLKDQQALLANSDRAKEASSASAEAAAAEVAALLKQIAAMNDSFRNERKALLDKIEDLMRDVAQKNIDIISSQRKLDDANAQKLKEINQLMDVHNAENKAKDDENNALRAANNKLGADNDKLQRDLSKANALNDDLKNKNKHLKEDNEALTSQNNALKSALKAAERDRDSLQNQVDRLALQGKQKDDRIAELLAVVDRLENEIDRLNDELGHAKEKHSKVCEDLKEAESKSQAREHELKKNDVEVGPDPKLEQLEDELAEARRQIAVQVEVNAKQRKELERVSEREVITKTMRMPDGLQDKIDVLTIQLRQAHILTQALALDMVPIEEITVEKTSNKTSEVEEKTVTEAAQAAAAVSLEIGPHHGAPHAAPAGHAPAGHAPPAQHAAGGGAPPRGPPAPHHK